MANNYDIDAKDSGFHMEKKTKNDHSMTQEEIKADLDKFFVESVNGAKEFSKKLIVLNAQRTGTDVPQEVLDSLETEKKAEIKTENPCKYFIMYDEYIIKVYEDKDKLYMLDKETFTWRENYPLMVDYNYGELHLKPIEISDTFPIGEPYDYRRSL